MGHPKWETVNGQEKRQNIILTHNLQLSLNTDESVNLN